MMKNSRVLILVVLSLSGCGVMDRLRKVPDSAPSSSAPSNSAPLDSAAAEAAPLADAAILGAQGKSATALDTTSADEKKAALAAPVAGADRELGKVVAGLGSPSEQGLWLRTSLVTADAKGRIVTPGGQSLAVDLRAGTGAAQLSLAAFQALGLGLTALPEVTVFGP